MWHTARVLNGHVCLVVVTHSLPAYTPPDSHQGAQLSWLYKCVCLFSLLLQPLVNSVCMLPSVDV